MNILIIDNSIAFTGAFKCALNESKLMSHRHKFHFVLPVGSSVADLPGEFGFSVATIPMRELQRSVRSILLYPIFLARNSFKLKRILRQNQIDVIQLNDFYNLLGPMAKLLGFKGKLFIHVRFLPSAIPLPLRKLWIGIGRRAADKFIAVSDAVLNQLPSSANTIRIYDPAGLKEKEKPKVYVDSGTVECLYLANYINGKGQQYAIEAFAIAYRNNNKLRLRFVGGDMGLEKNVGFRKELEAIAGALNLVEVVSFHSFDDNIESAIKQASIALNFSDGESFSMTCLEASFYGTPVIATRCGGPEEIIVHNATGLLVDKGDVQAMAAAISTLAGSPDLRMNLGVAGSAYVRDKFSVDNYIHQFEAILND